MRLFRSKCFYSTLEASKISISLPGQHQNIPLLSGCAAAGGRGMLLGRDKKGRNVSIMHGGPFYMQDSSSKIL